MADAIHISLAYFPFFTHKLEANFYQFFMEKNMCEIVKGMQFFPLLAYQAERCRNLDRWGLNGQRLDVHPPTLSPQFEVPKRT